MGTIQRCRSCDAPIRWAKTAAGKSMPLDADPVDHGNVTIVGWEPGSYPPVPQVVVGQLAFGDTPVDLYRYVSHFSTCPQAGVHRRTP